MLCLVKLQPLTTISTDTLRMKTASTRVTPWPSSPSASTMCSTGTVQYSAVQYSKYNVVNRERNTSVVSILFPRHVEVTRETFVKSGVSLGNIGEQKQNTLYYQQLNISVAEVGGYVRHDTWCQSFRFGKVFQDIFNSTFPVFKEVK